MSKRAEGKAKNAPKTRKKSLSRDEKVSTLSVSKSAAGKQPSVPDITVPESPKPEVASPLSPESPEKEVVPPPHLVSTSFGSLRRKSSLRELISTLSLYGIHHHTWSKKSITVLAVVMVLLAAGSVVIVWMALRRYPVRPKGTTPESNRECEAEQGEPQVRLESLGVTVHGAADGMLHKFFGIPYGTNVSGAQRFQPAQPVTSIGEGGVFYAYRHGPRCPQGNLTVRKLAEECLTLSIWAPVSCPVSTALKPVMVVLASDWFQFDYGRGFDTVWETLALGGDMIVAIINHRLGVLGFFDASSAAASAAAGAEDVFLGLTWISEHIKAFQGDPSLIVGLGLISGAYLATMDLFAEAQGKKRAFARLILHGASPTSLLPRTGLSSMTEIRASLECGSEASSVDCLRQARLGSIYAATTKQQWLLFAPSCDRSPIGACDRIYDKLPKNLTGTDILCGYNSVDGRNFFDRIFGEELRLPDDPKMLFSRLLEFFSGNRSQRELPHEVQQYLNKTNDTSIHGFKGLVSDMVLRCPMLELARAASARGATVHVYQSHGAHKLLEPAVMMADLIAFVKTGDVYWQEFSDKGNILLANGSAKRLLSWDSKECDLPTRLSRTVFH